MSKVPAIPDFSNSLLILHTLREVGKFYQAGPQYSGDLAEASAPRLPLPDEAYKSAVDVLHPLGRYLQMKAPDAQKEHLGDSIAADHDLIDHLCEGILMPFCQEISSSTGALREISGTNRLAVIRLLQVCLMEWTASHKMKEKLVKSGCVNMLFTELRNLTSTVHLTSNQFAQHLIQTAALVVGNCLSDCTDLYMRLHPLTDFEGALTPYFKCPNSIAQVVCKLSYYQFSRYLHQASPGSVDCPDDVTDYTHLLHAASKSPEFDVQKDKLFLEASELLKIVERLCVSATNRRVVVSSAAFHDAITNLLQNGRKREVECTLNLLLTLLSEGKLSRRQDAAMGKGKKGKKEEPKTVSKERDDTVQELLSRNPKLVHLLKAVCTGPHSACESVQELCSAVLWCVERGDTPENDVPLCLLYVGCCYQYGHYEECCRWTDYIRERSPGVKAALDPFLLYKGKALFHLYQQLQVLLLRSEKYAEVTAELKQERKNVYSKAKEVITILGSLKGRNVSDGESERFLDIALMDYIRELNSKPDIRMKIGRERVDVFYCMLCHEKQPIQRSHIVPEAVLRAIFKKDDQLFMMGPAGLPSDYHPRTFKTQTFYMLCNKCDNEILSRDEKPFVEEIVKPIYDTSSQVKRPGEVDGVAYGEWLFRFCCGMVFRGLALGRGITASINEEEIYKLFVQCRAVVQSLKTSEIPPEQLPTIAMFFTPGMLKEPSHGVRSPEEKPINLVRALNNGIFFTFSNVPLSSATPSVVRKRHFFVVHFGIFTIAAPFGPVPSEYKPFLVNPSSGVLNIPANDERLGLNPPGLQTVYEGHAQKAVRQYIEKVVEEDKRGETKVSIMPVQSDSAEAKYGVPPTFSLLPQGFVITRETNTVTVKRGHKILLHLTHRSRASASAGHTLFLAAEVGAPEGPSKPYVVIHSFVDPTKSLQSFGYYVSPHDFAFKCELDHSHKAMMKALRAKDLGLFKAPNALLPDAFARAGLFSYQSLLLHLNRPGTSTADRKCSPGDGCWYCASKCDVCMQESKPGFSIQTEEESRPRLRFCGEECKSFHGPPQVFAQLHKPVVTTPLVETCFTFIAPDSSGEGATTIKTTQLLHFDLPFCTTVIPTSAVIDVYRVEAGDEIKPGHLFTLFHLTNLEEQVFGEFYLTDECKLGRPLPHAKEHFHEDLVSLVNDLLQEGIRRSGHEIDNIPSLRSHELTTEQTPKSRGGEAVKDEKEELVLVDLPSTDCQATEPFADDRKDKMVDSGSLGELGPGVFEPSTSMDQAGEDHDTGGLDLNLLDLSAGMEKEREEEDGTSPGPPGRSAMAFKAEKDRVEVDRLASKSEFDKPNAEAEGDDATSSG